MEEESMNKMPWIKLWRQTLSDEKIAFLMRRYGHETLTFWVGLLTKAEDGVLLEDEEVFADLCQLEEKRYQEIRGIFLKHGLVVEDEDRHLVIPTWSEYQVGESTERSRRFRDRKRDATPMQRGGNAEATGYIDIELEGDKNTHTPREAETEEPVESSPVVAKPECVSEVGALYKAWTSLGARVLQPASFESFSRALHLPYPVSFGKAELLQAIANLGEILKAPPGRYFWDAKIGFEAFLTRHLERFLPDNFRAEDFAVREQRRPARRPEPERPSLVETYVPIPAENLIPPTPEELAELGRLVEENATKSPAGAAISRMLALGSGQTNAVREAS
jgi:hypothetical protein